MPRTDAARWITTAARAQKLTVDDRIETAIRDALDKTWTGNWKERVAIVAREEATYLHFLVIAELILMAQDRGTTSLVIAPEPSVDRVQAALGEALAAFAAGPTQRIFKVGQEDGASGRYDVVISSLQRLEAAVLSEENSSLKDARRRFGLVVVLGFHRLDIALLRLRLIRIARQIAKRDVLVFVQGDPRSGLEAQLAPVLAPLDVKEVRMLALSGRTKALRFQIFWRNDEATLRAFLDKDLGRPAVPHVVLDLPPFTLARACKQNIHATFFDLAGRSDSKAIEGLLEILPERMFCDAEGRRDLRELATFPRKGQCVIAIEDLGNLVEAAHRSTNFKDNPEVLLHVISHDYPLREFLASVIAQKPVDQLNRYLPITPSPKGGPAELALSIAEEIRHAKGKPVDVRAITRLIDAAEESGVRGRDLSSATSRAALAELLKSQLGYETTIKESAVAGHERQLEFQSSGLRLEPAYLVRVRQDGNEMDGLFLDRVDHGVTYVVGTHLQVRGTFCEVESVDDEQVRCETRDLPGRLLGGDGTNRSRYVFARLYDPFSDDGISPVLVDQKGSADEGGFQSLRLLLRGHVVRQTVAYREAIELARFLSRAGEWVDRDASATLPQTLQVLMRFRFAAGSKGTKQVPAQSVTQADGLARSRAAFTLASTLSDVLHSLFPQHGVRLAVISPQAAQAVVEALDTEDQTECFPAIAIPRLVTGIEQGHEGVGQRPCDGTEAEAHVSRLIRQQAGPTSPSLSDRQVQRFTDAKAHFLDLLLIEDASHDLGCLRALFENWSTVVAVWRPYVEWCAANCDEDWFHHWYGGKRLPRIFDFTAAAEIVRAMPEAANEARAEPAP